METMYSYEEAMSIVREGLRAWCEPRAIAITALKHERGYLAHVKTGDGTPFEAYTDEPDPEFAVTALIEELRDRVLASLFMPAPSSEVEESVADLPPLDIVDDCASEQP